MGLKEVLFFFLKKMEEIRIDTQAHRNDPGGGIIGVVGEKGELLK